MRSFEKWGVTSRACGKIAACALNAGIDSGFILPLREFVNRDNTGAWKFTLPDGNQMMARYSYHYVNIMDIEVGYIDEENYFSPVFTFKLSLPREQGRATIHIVNTVKKWTPTRGIMADTRTLRHWADMDVPLYSTLYTIGGST